MVNIIYINGAPLLHIIDEGIQFQTGKELQNISVKYIWDVL